MSSARPTPSTARTAAMATRAKMLTGVALHAGRIARRCRVVWISSRVDSTARSDILGRAVLEPGSGISIELVLVAVPPLPGLNGASSGHRHRVPPGGWKLRSGAST